MTNQTLAAEYTEYPATVFTTLMLCCLSVTYFDPASLHKMSTSIVSASQHFLSIPVVPAGVGATADKSTPRASKGSFNTCTRVFCLLAPSLHLCTASLDSNHASLWASATSSSVYKMPPCTCQRPDFKKPGLGGSSVLATQASAHHYGLDSFSNPTQLHTYGRSTIAPASMTSECLGSRSPRILRLDLLTCVPSAAVKSLRCRSL
jgi:hypothetical protein